MICGEEGIQKALVDVLDLTESVIGRVISPYKGMAMIDTLGRRKTVTDGHKILSSLTYPRNIQTYDKGMEDAIFNIIKEPALKIDSTRSSGDGTSAGSLMEVQALRYLLTRSVPADGIYYQDVYDNLMTVEGHTIPTVERESLIQDILDTFFHNPVQAFNMKKELSEDIGQYRNVLHNLGFTSCGDDSITETFIDAYIKGGAKAFIQIAESPTGEDYFETYDGVYQCDEVSLTRRSQANNTQQNAFKVKEGLPIICLEDRIQSDQSNLIKYLLEDDSFDQIILLSYGVDNICNAMLDEYYRKNNAHKIILLSIAMGVDQSINFVDDISIVTGSHLHRSVDLIMKSVDAFYDENSDAGYFDLGVGFVQEDSLLSVHGVELNLKTIPDYTGIDNRRSYLRTFIDGAKEDVKIKGNDIANIGMHQRRLAAFEGTNVKVYIGGKTPASVAARSYLAEDAQRAISNAVTEGILPGYFFLYRLYILEGFGGSKGNAWELLPQRSKDIIHRMVPDNTDTQYVILSAILVRMNKLLRHCIDIYTKKYILSEEQFNRYERSPDTFINTVSNEKFRFDSEMDLNVFYGGDDKTINGINVLDTATTQRHIIDMMFSIMNTLGNTRLFMSSLELERNDIKPMYHLSERG